MSDTPPPPRPHDDSTPQRRARADSDIANGSDPGMSSQTVTLIVGGMFAVVALVLGVMVLNGSEGAPPNPTAAASVRASTSDEPTAAPTTAAPTPASTATRSPEPADTSAPTPTPTTRPSAAEAAPPSMPAGDSDLDADSENVALEFPGGTALPDNVAGQSNPTSLLNTWKSTGLIYASAGDALVLDFEARVAGSSSGGLRRDTITTAFTTAATAAEISERFTDELASQGFEVRSSTTTTEGTEIVQLDGLSDDGSTYVVSVSEPNQETTEQLDLPDDLVIVQVTRSVVDYNWDGSLPTEINEALGPEVEVATQIGMASDGWTYRWGYNQFNPNLTVDTIIVDVAYPEDADVPGLVDQAASITDVSDRRDDPNYTTFTTSEADWQLNDGIGRGSITLDRDN